MIGLVARAHTEVGGQALAFHIAHGIGYGRHLEGSVELFLEEAELKSETHTNRHVKGGHEV